VNSSPLQRLSAFLERHDVWQKVIFAAIIAAPVVILGVLVRYSTNTEASSAVREHLLDLHGSAVSLRGIESTVAGQATITPADLRQMQQSRASFEFLGDSLGHQTAGNPALAAVMTAHHGYAAAIDQLVAAMDSGGDRSTARTETSNRFVALNRAIVNAERSLTEEGIARQQQSQVQSIAAAAGVALVSTMLLLVLFTQVNRARGREAARLATSKTEERFRALTEQSSDLVLTLDREGRIRYASPSAARLCGIDPQRLVGLPLAMAVHEEDAELLKTFVEALSRAPQLAQAVECRFRTGPGDFVDLDVVGRNLLDHPDVGEMVLNARDVSERNRTAERLRHDALHDRLTGLPNRTLVLERIRAALSSSRDGGARSFAVVFLDLDGFKTVNDVYGHAAGDRLLCLVTERLAGILRIPECQHPPSQRGPLRPPPSDTLSRLGGDEFVVLLHHIDDPRAAMLAANRMQDALKAPFILDGREVRITASIGISLGPQRYRTPDELLRDADIAMYRAKTTGQTQPQLFDQAMHDVMAARLTLETDLRAALEHDQFVLHFQPIVTADTRELCGFEALLRWQHPTRGLLPAGEFVETAEATRLILPLGRWVFREACRQIAAWLEQFPDLPAGVVSVNVSAFEAMQPDTVQFLLNVLAESGVSGRHLKIELTESVAMRDPNEAVAWCRAIRASGVQVGLDDFGTGYCSLAYLRRLDIDFLKIDRTLVQDATLSERTSGVLEATVAIARSLKLGVVFEGIETPEHEARIAAFDGALLQGHGIGRPMSAADATKWLEALAARRAETAAARRPHLVRARA
jgi:PAS domain S-box-containing protein